MARTRARLERGSDHRSSNVRPSPTRAPTSCTGTWFATASTRASASAGGTGTSDSSAPGRTRKTNASRSGRRLRSILPSGTWKIGSATSRPSTSTQRYDVTSRSERRAIRGIRRARGRIDRARNPPDRPTVGEEQLVGQVGRARPQRFEHVRALASPGLADEDQEPPVEHHAARVEDRRAVREVSDEGVVEHELERRKEARVGDDLLPLRAVDAEDVAPDLAPDLDVHRDRPRPAGSVPDRQETGLDVGRGSLDAELELFDDDPQRGTLTDTDSNAASSSCRGRTRPSCGRRIPGSCCACNILAAGSGRGCPRTGRTRARP